MTVKADLGPGILVITCALYPRVARAHESNSHFDEIFRCLRADWNDLALD